MNRGVEKSFQLHARRRSEALRFGLAIVGLLLLFFISFSVGRFPITFGELLNLVWSKITGMPTGLPGTVEAVVFKVRRPRVLAAMVVAPAAVVYGAVNQPLLRIPLVSLESRAVA